MTATECQSLVAYGKDQGWLRFPEPERGLTLKEKRERQRRKMAQWRAKRRGPDYRPPLQTEKITSAICMARRRAELRGEDTSMFPPRLRKRRTI